MIPNTSGSARRPRRAGDGVVPPVWSAAVGLYALALYLALTPAVPGMKDSSELGLVLAVAGVPHPTGYPLYVLLGHAFSVGLHAMGMGWWHAANAWSAVGAAVAVSLSHALASRLLPSTLGRGARFALALGPTWLLSLNPVWLQAATLAEVHAWQVAWVSGSGLLALHIVRGLSTATPGHAGRTHPGSAPAPASVGARLPGLCAAWGLVSGAGLAHHATALLFLLPLAAAVIGAVVRARLWRGSLIAWWAAGAVVPLASYGFIAYRAFHPAPYQWPPLEPTLASVVDHVTGASFRFYLGHFAPSEAGRAALMTTVYPFLFPGLIAFPFLAAANRSVTGLAMPAALFAGAVLQTLFALHYGVADVAPYFIPPLLVALLSLPLAAGWLASRLGRVALLSGLLAVAPLIAAVSWIQGAVAETRGQIAYEREVRARWRSIPFEQGIVLWRDDKYCRLRAYQILDGEKPGLVVEHPGMLTWTQPREDFRRRVGFDPLAGLVLREEDDIRLIPDNVRRQTDLPVIDFAEWQGGPAAGAGERPVR